VDSRKTIEPDNWGTTLLVDPLKAIEPAKSHLVRQFFYIKKGGK